MEMNKYQELAARTINRNLSEEEAESHALHGLSAEVGEIHSIYQKSYQGHEINEENIKKEIGDVLWMIAELCTVCGWQLADIAKMNIEKLMKRYPDGFDPKRSVNREC